MVAVAAPLVLGKGASAFPYEKVPGYGSKDEFKRDCTGFPGATFDAGQYSTACTYPDGDVKVCDENGKNCTYHESELTTPGWLDGVLGGLDPLPAFTQQPADEPADSAPKARGKRKKGGKRRKR
jgi:hypothetical protein